MQVSAREGEPMQIDCWLLEKPQIKVTVHSAEPLGVAQNRALTRDFLADQLGRLGNTAYELAELDAQIVGNPFAPASLLNQLRRDAVEQLVALQGREREITVGEPLSVLGMLVAHEGTETVRTAFPRGAWERAEVHLLVRTAEQLEASIGLQPASITLDYLELYGLRPSVERIKESGIEARVASPRVLKPNEQRIVNFLLRLECPILVRSGGLLKALQQEGAPTLIGDFSLNAANLISSQLFLDLGIARLTPTHDLNAAQIAQLAHAIGGEKLEVIAYQHLPVFHTEHCVFCRFLSKGTSYLDCGHPCESHKVALRDVNGRAHPVMADVGCRNTVFGAEAQEASAHLDAWQQAGIVHYRLEFVHESAEQVAEIGRAFQVTLQGKQSPQKLAQRLKQIAPQGITEGSLFVPEGYAEIPLLV